MTRTLLIPLLFLPTLLCAQNEALAQLEKARDAYARLALEAALAHADSAITLDKGLPGAHKLRGDIKQRGGDMHGALVDYTVAEKLDDQDPRLYVSRSALYVTEGRLREAFRDTDRALKLSPNDADALYNRACASYMAHNNEGALRDLDKAVAARPTHADALFLRGVVKGELFKEAEGLEDIQAAMRLKPEIIDVRISAAVLLYEMARYEEAVAAFTEVIEAGENLPEAHYYRADCHYNLGNKGAACVDWRRSADLGDRDAAYIVKHYCMTDAEKIPKKPRRKRSEMRIEF
ncbi:MAG: tetratricopeptide repeat protein [Flavobacteriales bacterium]|jgi:tetratricopeptide (TPR) repeat protein|nr:tetratricopeptide repeat protein [Flavobacteriales bacterium]